MKKTAAMLVAGALTVAGLSFALAPTAHQPVPQRTAGVTAAKPGPVNDECPIRGGELDAESPTREHKGYTIGFCCPGCEKKWDKMAEADKTAFLAKYVPDIDKQPTSASPEEAKALGVARAYIAFCEKGEIEPLNALFLRDGKATILENASDEGIWEQYRDHHLAPELKEMPGFKFTAKTESTQAVGGAVVVRQVGSFTLPAENEPGGVRTYLSAVTYVVVDDAGTPRIAHLHWSSRAQRKP